MTIIQSTVPSLHGYKVVNTQRTHDEFIGEELDRNQDHSTNSSTKRYMGPRKGSLHPYDRIQDHSDEAPQSSEGFWAKTGRPFVRWMLTPIGFLITIYGLNIVAWGGMLFLLMCNAAPAMCHPDCDSVNSSRRIWIEIDSQILNALFCVTGFGLAPWRIRDLYFWGLWRFSRSERSRHRGLVRLADIHANWFRRPQEVDMLPTAASSSAKLEMAHLTPTAVWKMDVVVWGNMLNTVFQICLALCMWTMNRLNRPSWTTGLFVCLACLVVGIAGLVTWLEQRQIKKEHAEGLTDAKPQPGT
ncbi:hypothetical protein BDV38DRAFT_281400 [Aspergillus pseudotamarii]|uniref:Alpha-L-rhamnosidase C n=1 Tax=Aspergillus pseudotamarii TaxID=132259 RepID=A0A5N6SX39_ASPPS|nr:uncharacterized protein BDV38DRAFT_281400 [Aspergillus pseudotamarii]KAE8139236.1 hypothetical protein BDV38DRAFT_281400 [Aspergillus pseudotamarii]